MDALDTYEYVYTSKYSDLSFELGLTQYSQDILLKRQPQREKATVFGSNTTHNRVFSVVTQSYSVHLVKFLVEEEFASHYQSRISVTAMTLVG
jgi:hypothetical protein